MTAITDIQRLDMDIRLVFSKLDTILEVQHGIITTAIKDKAEVLMAVTLQHEEHTEQIHAMKVSLSKDIEGMRNHIPEDHIDKHLNTSKLLEDLDGDHHYDHQFVSSLRIFSSGIRDWFLRTAGRLLTAIVVLSVLATLQLSETNIWDLAKEYFP